MISSTLFLLLSLASSIVAKTDLTGCTSSNLVVNGGASVLWYVPSDGEICDFLDCGGGTAPVKTNVPGCPAYSGTASYTPSFLPGYGSEATATPNIPSKGIPTGSGFPLPSSTFITASATTTSLSDTTTTLGEAGTATANTASLVTTAIIFDTSAASKPVTNMITVTTSTLSAATANAAATGALNGKEILIAAIGAAAGLAFL